MDWSYIHLLVNHFPVILSVVGTAAVLVALVTRRRDLWRYATLTLLLAGLAAYPVFFTGDEAGDVMEKKWYVTREAIHEHEEASDFALWSLLIAGAVSGYALWRTTRRGVAASGTRIDSLEAPTWLRAALALLALWSTSVVARTSYLGGEIVHKAAALQTPPPGYVPPPDTGRPGGER